MIDEIKTHAFVNKSHELKIQDKDIFFKTVKSKFQERNFEFIAREIFYQFSSKLRGYFFKVIVSEIQSAYLYSGVLKSKQDVYEELKYKFLYYEELNIHTDKYERFVYSLSEDNAEVTNKMMREFILKCIIFAASSLDWKIQYPSEEFGFEDLSDTQKEALYKSKK